jgi:hypothetical protein
VRDLNNEPLENEIQNPALPFNPERRITMNHDSSKLILRYSPTGQFTFTRFDRSADDEKILELAQTLNAFQEEEAQYFKVQTFSVW